MKNEINRTVFFHFFLLLIVRTTTQTQKVSATKTASAAHGIVELGSAAEKSTRRDDQNEHYVEKQELINKETFNKGQTSGDFLLRHRRGAFVTDHGYGTRLHAGSNAARLTLGKDVYGIHGPGKRFADKRGELDRTLVTGYRYNPWISLAASSNRYLRNPIFRTHGHAQFQPSENFIKDGENEFSPELDTLSGGHSINADPSYNLEQISIPDGFPRQARSNFDSGYGSRIQTGAQVAADRTAFDDVFGNWGVGKRSQSPENNIEQFKMDVGGLAGDSEKRAFSDMGYGSRIVASARIARAKAAKNLFGYGGPGKR